MAEKDEEWKAIGERLREAREYRGYSQEEIANYLGISRSAVSLSENGDRKVNSIELRKLARLYGVTTDDLIAADDQPPEDDEEVEMVARAARELSEEDRREVLRFVQFLRSKQVEGGNDESAE